MSALQPTAVSPTECLEVVERALQTIAAADPTLPVALGPGRTVADVVDWTAGFAAAAAEQLASVALAPCRPLLTVPGLAVAAPALLDALSTVPPRRPCWTPSAAVAPQAQFWLRRSAHALSVRAWQVLVAMDDPASLPSWLALDGIDEHLQVLLAIACGDPELAAGRAAGTISVRCTDAAARWTLRLQPGCVPLSVADDEDDQSDAELVADAATLRLGMAGMLPLPQGRGEPALLAALRLR